jgi:hypothetical protein
MFISFTFYPYFTKVCPFIHVLQIGFRKCSPKIILASCGLSAINEYEDAHHLYINMKKGENATH